uniref:Uncharacterized protein n=1 Tax=Salmonella phage vB_SEnST11_KE06 TaxID=3161164 RepID=A0AAU8GG59_9CAUD
MPLTYRTADSLTLLKHDSSSCLVNLAIIVLYYIGLRKCLFILFPRPSSGKRLP